MPTPEEDAAAAAAANAGTSWFDGVDAETKGYIENRGLDKLDAKAAALSAINAHREATKKLGAKPEDLFRTPKDAADQEAWDRIHAIVGKPKESKDYDFTPVKDADLAEAIRNAAFSTNTPKAAAEAIAKVVAAHQDKAAHNGDSEALAKLQAEKDELKKGWSVDYNANMLVAQRAAEALGFTKDELNAAEKSKGYGHLMRMMHRIGQKIGEDNFVTSRETGRVMSPDGAKARIAELKADDQWRARYTAGGSKEQKEFNDLHLIAHGS